MFFRYHRHQKADAGVPGGKRADGKNAKNLILKVPIGTCVFTDEGELIADLNREGQQYTIAKGGQGGKGNRSLITKNNPVPKFAEKGQPGEEMWVRMELKLTAEIGIIGFPNVGKSTLIAKLSNAKPKIADYPFTTLVPNLGMVPVSETDSILVADIPGIIEGAADGQGLGHQFLRHIERTGMLLHMIDLFPYDQTPPYESFLKVNKELTTYSEKLSEKHQVVVLNKIDMPEAQERAQEFRELAQKDFPNLEIHTISALTGEGCEKLRYRMAELVNEHPAQMEIFEGGIPERQPKALTVEAVEDYFVVSGDEIERIVQMTDLQNEEANRRLQNYLVKKGVIDKLKKLGAEHGNIVVIDEYELDFYDDTFDSPFIGPDDDDDFEAPPLMDED